MTMILKAVVAVTGIALATALGGTGIAAAASPKATLTVQDADSGHDGAVIDSDGTQGSYKAAMDGASTGPIMDAVPQKMAST